MRIRIFLLFLLALSLNQIIFAQKNPDSDFTMDIGQLIISATKTPKNINSIPGSIVIINKDEIENSSAAFADDTLNTISGSYQKRSKLSDTTASISLRGFEGSKRTLVLIDGQALNDAYNLTIEWPAVSLDNIEKIEIVKGPFSSLYGSAAMGGVINIITKSPSKRELKVNAAYGQDNTFSTHINYADKLLDNLNLNLNIDKLATDGYRSQPVVKSASTGTANTTVTGWEETKSSKGITQYLIGDKGLNFWNQLKYSGKVNWDISSISKLSINFNVSDSLYGYKDPQSYLKDNDGTEITNGSVTFDNSGDKKISLSTYQFLQGDGWSNQKLIALDYQTLFKDINFKSRISYSQDGSGYITTSSGATTAEGPGKINETTPKISTQIATQFDIPLINKHLLTIGIEHRQDSVEGKESTLTNWTDKSSKTDLLTSMQGKQSNQSVFAQLEAHILDNVTAYLGGRYDYWRNFDGESMASNTTTTYESKTHSQFSPKISGIYQPQIVLANGLWQINAFKAAYGKTFRGPTLYEQYKTWTYYSTTYNSNPDLKPETGTSWEIGFDQSFFQNTVKLSATYFESDIQDLIYNKQVTTNVKKYENAGKGEIKGYEIDFTQYITPWLSAFANYTQQNTEITENDADATSVGKQFIKVPQQMYNLGLKLHQNNLDSSLTWRWVAKVYGSSDNSDTESSVYGSYDQLNLLDFYLGYSISKNIRISLNVDNVLDEKYYQYYLAPGRSFLVKIGLNY